MILRKSLAVAVCLAAFGSQAWAQTSTLSTTTSTASTYAPSVGQPGKDVVWVPTPQALVDRMLDMAGLTAQDILVDLGSGDGRTVITAAQRGAKARGIEFNPDMVALSRKAAQEAGVTERVVFEEADILKTDFSEATVLTLFLLPELNVRLRPTILDMKPGTRVVSNSFTMGDWEPDETSHVSEGCSSYCNALKWVVPAKVAGTWKLNGQNLELTQTYQKLEGTLQEKGKPVAIADGRMDGAKIHFKVGDKHYAGTVSGNAIEGTVDGGNAWKATR